MPPSKEQSLRGRLAAYSLHAKVDSRAQTQAARDAFYRTFLDQVDPDRTLPEEERYRRAEAARRAYYLRLALKSVQSRQARRANRKRGA